MRTKSHFLCLFEDAVISIVVTCIRLLPRKVSHVVCQLLLRSAFLFLGSKKRTARQNIKIGFPDLSEAGRESILKGEIESLGRLLWSVSNFGSITKENYAQFIEQTDDLDFLREYDRLKQTGVGRIIVGAHLGNWELLALVYPMLFEPLHFLSRKLDNPLLEQWLNRIRTRLGNTQIDKANSAGPILRVLRKGGAVGILADVNVSLDDGVFVPFFNLQASTTKGISLLSLRTGAAIIPIFAVWDNKIGKCRVVHGRIIEPKSSGDIYVDDIRMTAEFTLEIEKIIREYPEQWMWIHKRWKTRPPGEPDIYARKK